MECKCKECYFDITSYIGTKSFKKNRSKAGVIIHDPDTDSLLIVQSRGNLWGFPKGSMEEGESSVDTALREVKEETGISLVESDLGISHNISKNITYYVSIMSRKSIKVQEIDGNDVNSIAWLNINCLQELILTKKIKLNSHARILSKKIFNISSFFDIK